MKVYEKLYINGSWIEPQHNDTSTIIDPSTEAPIAQIPLGSIADANLAVKAARAAFNNWSQTTAKERCRLIHAITAEMERRKQDLAEAISSSMGCPRHMTADLHVSGPTAAMESFAERAFMMEEIKTVKNSLIVREPVGVCAFINPWNYPLHQLVGKVAPALAAGCTMVVKPAELTPLQDFIMAEIFDTVGLPSGVFNLVTGSGSVVGEAITSHPEVDMVSFTGSTQAGIRIAQNAAKTVKRVTQELGGKSPFIITEKANLEEAINYGVKDVMINSGQTCTALTRMLVPESRYQEATSIARRAVENITCGPDENSFMGPMASAQQKAIVLNFIKKGVTEGAQLITGGTDAPEGLTTGFYVKPTIFANVYNQMSIAREEIFGPVLCMIPYTDIDEAVAIANDSPYGLSSGVYAEDNENALKIARRLRAGQCYINGGSFNYQAPFGGYKQSGNGREFGDEGLHEFVEIKAIQTK